MHEAKFYLLIAPNQLRQYRKVGRYAEPGAHGPAVQPDTNLHAGIRVRPILVDDSVERSLHSLQREPGEPSCVVILLQTADGHYQHAAQRGRTKIIDQADFTRS